LPTADDLEDPDAFVHGQDQFDISDLDGDQSAEADQDAEGDDPSDA
jgi:hypothetical protein